VKPQKQRYRHAEDVGHFGDCHRTCIAMILNMERDDVPHFMAGVSPDLPAEHPLCKAAERAEIEWLARYGLTPFNIGFYGETPLTEILQMLKSTAHGAPCILGCTSTNGCNHSVVIHEGQIYNPNDGQIAGPMRDGYWWLTIYSVGPDWRSPRWRDRLRELFRRFSRALAIAAGTR
jgi:hypothetical protein